MTSSVMTFMRGSTLKLFISIMINEEDYRENTTAPTIKYENLAEIIVKFQLTGQNSLNFHVRMKKSEAAKNFKVSANIKYGNMDKQFTCTDQWKEEEITRYLNYANFGILNIDRTSYVKTFLFIVMLDITVQASMHAEPIVNNLLYEDDQFTDFQLQAADGTVAVHKAVLAMHGDMFKTMLSGEWKETEKGIININGITVQTLQHLKKYMYLGTLPDEGIEPLLLMAAPYLMEKLETDCIKKLIETLKPEKFDDLIEFAFQNNITKLVRALVLRIPDDIVNGVHQLDLKKQKSDDEK